MTISQEQFDAALARILDESPASHLLSVPGVYEAVSEYFNNAVLALIAEEAEPAPGDSDAWYCEDCGELIDSATRGCETQHCPSFGRNPRPA